MTKFPGLIVLIIYAAVGVFSQAPCTNEDAYNTPGVWIKQKRDNFAGADSSFPKTQFPVVLDKAQKVIELLKLANPAFKGIQAYAYRSIIGDSYTPGGALQFRVDGVYDAYICVGNDTSVKEARGTVLLNGNTFWITVRFNDLGGIATEKSVFYEKLVTASGDKIYISPKASGELKGFPVFKPISQESGKQEAVLVTAQNRTPFRILTREEYLQARNKILEVQINELKEIQRRSIAQNEIDIKKIDGNPSFNAQQKSSIKESFRQSQSEQQKVIAKAETDSAAISAAINAMPAGERNAQAIVSDVFALPSTGKLFASEAEGGKPLVIIDKSFFDPKLPRPTIQLIAVSWSWDEKHPAKNAAIQEFKKNFDFVALGQMLGK